MKLFSILILILWLPVHPQKYEKDISPNEKRITDLKKEKNLPENWKLFYKGKESDFVVFYDWDGNEIYFQYRRDALDREAEKKIVGLFVGQAYRIRGQFKGLILYRDEKENKDYLPPILQFGDSISMENKFSTRNIPIFGLISFESTALDEVLK